MRRSILSALFLAAAGAILIAGFARALDLGPGDETLRAASQAAHEQHTKPAAGKREHNAHRTTAVPPALLDDGRYALQVDQQVVPTGTRRLAFTITNVRDAKPQTRFDDDLTKKLHLIVIREDLTGFQHVHPQMDARGRWTARDAVLDRPGPWRLIADFIPTGGRKTALSTAVHVSGGDYRPRPPRESQRAGEHRWRTTAGAYTVTLTAERFGAGSAGTLRFEVHRDGKPVADLQPYLGALGHTVLLRWGDVAYTHVHPREGKPKPGQIIFDVTYPRAAPAAMFLQFRHRGVVRTATFGLPIPPAHDE